MANYYVSSVGYTAVAQFAITTAYSIGNIIRQLAAPAVGSERCFRCTTAGTSGGSEATWNLTKGATTTQGTSVFTEVSGNETYQAAGAWAAPHARLGNVTGTWGLVAGDTIYVAANHAESTAATVTIGLTSFTPASIICVDQSGTGHVPPQAGDTRTTASITITGSFNTFQFAALVGYVYGLNITMSGSFQTLYQGQASSVIRFESCTFVFSGSSSVVSPIANAWVEWLNCQYTPFGSTSAITSSARMFRWRNPSGLAAVGGATAIAGSLFTESNASAVYLEALDFSALAHTRLVGSTSSNNAYSVIGCKLHASTATSNQPQGTASVVDFLGTDSGSATYRNERWAYMGTLTTETTAVHTAGASDGTTAVSWKVVTNANAAQRVPFEAFPIAQWNTATGSSKAISFEAIVNGATVLTNAQLWADVAYLGTSSSILASIDTTGAAALATATNVTTSTQAWDSIATARANAHVYAIGDIIKLASNTGRIFFCTTAGTSAGSEPGGYASAVDGGSVTDNTAVFRAGVRMKVSLSVTPQVAGLIRVIPKVGATSVTLYIDPLLSIV